MQTEFVELYPYDLFVIYARPDADFVRGYLLPALNLPSSRVLLIEELMLGALTISEIDRSVSCSRFTVVVLSPAYFHDRWAAFGEQLASHLGVHATRVIPLLLVDCNLPTRLEARVALDFTDRARWDSELARLHDRLHAVSRPVPAAEPPHHPDRHLHMPHGAAVSYKLELADASFVDVADDPSCQVLDLKLINRSVRSIVVKRVNVHVREVWTVASRDTFEWRGALLSSGSYHLGIPDRAPPFAVSLQVSHVLRPDEADRFQIAVSSAQLQARSVLAVIAISLEIVHGDDDAMTSSKELLCVFQTLECSRWDVDTRRAGVLLAEAVRERSAHVGPRLGRILADIEAADP